MQVKEATTFKENTFYFPGWTSAVDGIPVAITQVMPFGHMKVSVPEGRHRVEFSWKETPLERRRTL